LAALVHGALYPGERRGLSHRKPTLEHRTLIFSSRDSKAVLGAVSLMPVDRYDGVWKLGYWVRADVQRSGLARRAAAMLCQAAFVSRATVQRVSILVAVGNTPSRRVAEALGAQLEGRA
jgi:RimJ/RimL family protein N-acetyltransferase